MSIKVYLAAGPLSSPTVDAVDVTCRYMRIQRPERYKDERRLENAYKKHHAVFFI